jgi:hypothetical protein
VREREALVPARDRQELHDGVAVVARGRVNGHARRFGDGEEVVVLVKHGQLGGDGNLVPRLAPQQNALLGEDAIIGREPVSGRVECAAPHDELGAGATGALELALDEAIQPHSGRFRWNPQDGDHGVGRDFVGPARFLFVEPETGHEGASIARSSRSPHAAATDGTGRTPHLQVKNRRPHPWP